ncbi:MAG: hypothetical protein WC340_12090 [Kiritimatiellia bacterium]
MRKGWEGSVWKQSGHLELCEVRKRYRIIDRKALRLWFMDVPWIDFREWYLQASNAKWNNREYAEEKWWEDALVVGEQKFCEQVADSISESRRSLAEAQRAQRVVAVYSSELFAALREMFLR